VRHGIPFLVVILDDGAYGSEYRKLERHGFDPSLCFVRWPDFAEVARALGGSGVTVRSEADLREVLRDISKLDRPLLIDVKTDPRVDYRDS
jgi:acetolactate synthase I/II/III large subunit